MPKATVDTSGERFDVLTAPPDGYVVLKKLPFGLILERRDRATRLSMEQQANRAARRRRQPVAEDSTKMNIEFFNAWTTQFDFEHCILEHNLEDESGRTLNLSSPMDIQMLDPLVGQEVQRLIDDLNGQNEEEQADFTTPATQSTNVRTLEPTNSE